MQNAFNQVRVVADSLTDNLIQATYSLRRNWEEHVHSTPPPQPTVDYTRYNDSEYQYYYPDWHVHACLAQMLSLSTRDVAQYLLDDPDTIVSSIPIAGVPDYVSVSTEIIGQNGNLGNQGYQNDCFHKRDFYTDTVEFKSGDFSQCESSLIKCGGWSYSQSRAFLDITKSIYYPSFCTSCYGFDTRVHTGAVSRSAFLNGDYEGEHVYLWNPRNYGFVFWENHQTYIFQPAVVSAYDGSLVQHTAWTYLPQGTKIILSDSHAWAVFTLPYAMLMCVREHDQSLTLWPFTSEKTNPRAQFYVLAKPSLGGSVSGYMHAPSAAQSTQISAPLTTGYTGFRGVQHYQYNITTPY